MITPIDRKIVKRFLLRQVKGFASQETVYFLQAGFGINQSGLFSIYIDTTENAGPDGSWTKQLEDQRNVLRMPLWRFYVDENVHAKKLINLIKSIILECKDEGLFKMLNLHSSCDFGIEELDGIDGWPSFEDRHKLNLLA